MNDRMTACDPPLLLPGLNHNVRHNGRLYHVQTELKTVRGARQLQSVVFHEGAVLFKTHEACSPEAEDYKRRVTLLHKKAIIHVLSGRLEKGPLPQKDDGDSQESSATIRTLGGARTGGKPQGVDQARAILVELSGLDGFRGLGVFGKGGQVVSSLSAANLDIQAVGDFYGELLGRLREEEHRDLQDSVDWLTIKGGRQTVLVASFETLFEESARGFLDTLSHIIVVLAADVPQDDIRDQLRGFMALIVAELHAYRHRGTPAAQSA